MTGESAAGPAPSSGLLWTGTWVVTPVEHRKLELPGGPAAPQRARRGVDQVFGDVLGDESLALANLLVTELVSNAVRHGGATDGTTIVLHLAVAPGLVRVEVCDRGPGFEPGRPAPYGHGGYGLFLVDELASRWGVDTAHGTCAWFEIDRGREG